MQPNNKVLEKEKQQFMYFIDSHTHLLDYERESHLKLDQMLKQCHQENVKYIAANTCCTNQFQTMQELYKNSSTQQLTLIPCFGIHPCYICQQLKQSNINKDWKSILKQYLTKNPLSHVGEIGLDFRKDVIQTNPQDKQWEYFQTQFQIAIQLKRSVTIHCVRAYGQLLKYLKKQNTKQKLTLLQDRPVIILHSYGGSKQITKSLNKLQNLNIYFSLSLKHSKDILQIIPIQKVIMQTDAPYQNDAKVLVQNGLWTQEELDNQEKQYNQFIVEKNASHREMLKQCKFFNKSILNNRPKNVIANYREVAKSYKLDLNTFTQKVTQNALKAFKLLK